MNLVNITKHLLYLTQAEFDSANSTTSADEVFAAQQLLKALKAFKDSCFSELDTYETLEFDYEEESNDESDNYDENDETDDYDTNQQMYIRSHFALEEMKNIIEWIDQHPNFSFSSIQRRFRKVKYRNYISRFRE